jgi:hypothetical protein
MTDQRDTQEDEKDKPVKKDQNDGMNTPVRGRESTQEPTEEEKRLLRQAENPLGDPDKK